MTLTLFIRRIWEAYSRAKVRTMSSKNRKLSEELQFKSNQENILRIMKYYKSIQRKKQGTVTV